MSYQVYRRSKLGDCLVDALDELISADKITPPLAMKILSESMCTTLEHEVTAKTTFKGKLDTYRFCDNVWTFLVSDATFKTSATGSTNASPEAHVDKVQIVAVDAKLVVLE